MTERDGAAAQLWREETGPDGAPLVVLVHGSMDRSAGLLKLARRLDGHLRVLRYDRRGYGRSARRGGPFGIDEQVADLVAVLDGRPAVVFGHSYGGNVALATADRHPALVRAVGVYETPLSWLEWWPGSTAGADALATRGEPADAAERFMVRLVGAERWDRLPAATRAARRAEGPAMVGELVDLRSAAPWEAARVRVPAVDMHGTNGVAHHVDSARYLGEVLADCRVVGIDGARHFGPNTHPDDVAREVLGLVSRVATGS